MSGGSLINGKKLKQATMAFPIHTPETGQLGPKLSSEKTNQTQPVEMLVSEPWVIVTCKTKTGKAVTIPVPISSFTHTQLLEE